MGSSSWRLQGSFLSLSLVLINVGFTIFISQSTFNDITHYVTPVCFVIVGLLLQIAIISKSQPCYIFTFIVACAMFLIDFAYLVIYIIYLNHQNKGYDKKPYPTCRICDIYGMISFTPLSLVLLFTMMIA